MKINFEITSLDNLWNCIEEHQGKTFYTIKKLPFTYTIKGGELFVDRRSKSITKATFEQALEKLQENSENITGPKSLCVFGAPYIWALLKAFEII